MLSSEIKGNTAKVLVGVNDPEEGKKEENVDHVKEQGEWKVIFKKESDNG